MAKKQKKVSSLKSPTRKKRRYIKQSTYERILRRKRARSLRA